MVSAIKKNNTKTLKWLLKNSSFALWRIAFLSLCAVALSYISVRFAFVSKQLLDSATGSGGNLWHNIKVMIILVAVQLLIQLAYTLIHLHTETEMKNRLSRNLFKTLLGKKWSHLTHYHSGELMNRIGTDTGIVTTGVMSIVPNLFSFVSRIVLGFVALYSLDKSFALIFLVICPFIMAVAKIYSKKIKPLHKECLSRSGKTQSFMLESLQNVLVIKSFGASSRMSDLAHLLQKDHLKMVMKRGYLSIFANILFFISLTIGYYFAVGWCAWKISLGLMTVGTFTAIIQLVGQVQTPFKDLASVAPQVYAVLASSERIIELEDIEDEKFKYHDVDFLHIYNKMETISANGLTFSYDEEPVLEDASICIPKNSLTTICGTSGIGKSTLMKLMLAILEPSRGNITINCEDGTSYETDASLRPLFAYVPQGNMVLSGTIRKNISFMSDETDESKIIEAAKAACIYDAIQELEDGFDTPLGEGGTGLSEGQLQRLSVARAIYSGAPIILLDEATSALDGATEKQMLSNIKALDNRTCIIISHKDGALAVSDKVLYIENGKIYEKQ